MKPIALFVLSTENFIDPDKDTSYVLMLEAQKRGMNILICDHRSIKFTYDKNVKKINKVISERAECIEVLNRKDVKDSVYAPSSWGIDSDIEDVKTDKDFHILKNFKLTNSTVIFMRSDPPVDDEYLDACSCLEYIKDEVFIVNNPSALISFNEKLCTLNFPDLIPKTYILENLCKQDLDSYIEIFTNGVVIKPLNLCGGEGVQKYDGTNFDSLELKDNKYIIQEFISEVYDGDKRVIILNGKPIGAILRMAKEGSFICNFHSGGTPRETDITDGDNHICNVIKDFLLDNGIYFAGIDIIGGKLTEINITSPTCIQEINRANKVKLEENVLDFILSKI